MCAGPTGREVFHIPSNLHTLDISRRDSKASVVMKPWMQLTPWIRTRVVRRVCADSYLLLLAPQRQRGLKELREDKLLTKRCGLQPLVDGDGAHRHSAARGGDRR